MTEMPPTVLQEIVHGWRLRQRYLRATNALILQGRALCRAFTDGDKELANALYDRIAADEESGELDTKIINGTATPEEAALRPLLIATKAPREECERFERTLERLAVQLPLWKQWGKDVKGLGEHTFASLIGEAGHDITSYRSPACLWKRFGLAVIRGQRQRRVTDEELAEEMGYNPSRRAVAWVMADSLLRSARKQGPYYAYYLQVKANADHDVFKTRMHIHKHARRLMTKRILRDMWNAAQALAQETKIAA
jgi:hypothetical protein